MERVSLARREVERIQVDSLSDFLVLATDIDDELVVDEYPDVIVAIEFKVLALDVDELGLDLHGEAVVVVTRDVVATAEGVVMRVFYGLCAIEPAEVIEQEETAFRAFVIFLTEPETIIGKREFQVAAGDVRVCIYAVVVKDFGEEPIVKVGGVRAAGFREVLRSHGNSVRAELLFDHSRHWCSLAAVRAKVFACAYAEHRDAAHVKACAACAAIAIAEAVLGTVGVHGSVVPVKHHDRENLREAFAKDAWIVCMNFGSAVLVSDYPDGIAECNGGIQIDWRDSCFVFGRAIGPDKCRTDCLLEVDVCGRRL